VRMARLGAMSVGRSMTEDVVVERYYWPDYKRSTVRFCP
jgi:hypothetical protein